MADVRRFCRRIKSGWSFRYTQLYASVASGNVEIGFNQISEVLAQPTVELAGTLPSAIQNYTQFAPGIVTGSSQTEAARALVTFLSSPAAQTVLKAKGFE